MNKQEIQALISEKIKANGKGEITADVLAEVLNGIVDVGPTIIDIPRLETFEEHFLDVTSYFDGKFDKNNPQNYLLKTPNNIYLYFKGAVRDNDIYIAMYGYYDSSSGSTIGMQVRLQCHSSRYELRWEDQG